MKAIKKHILLATYSYNYSVMKPHEFDWWQKSECLLRQMS